jgi:hypothetical protein
MFGLDIENFVYDSQPFGQQGSNVWRVLECMQNFKTLS